MVVVERDPIAQTRAAVRELVGAVGDPRADQLVDCMVGEHRVGRSTVYTFLSGRDLAGWRTVAALVEACQEHHRRAHTRWEARREHKEWVERGRFDLAVFSALYRQDTGSGDGEDPKWAVARARYLRRIRDRYPRIDLEILTPLTEQGEHPVMLLEQVFTPQHVRADPPPMEVPREVWRRLADTGVDNGDLPGQVDKEKLRAALRAYHDRPARPVLDVVADPTTRKLVLLGDPGAGKSTLARYLMLALASLDGLPDGSGPHPRQEAASDRDGELGKLAPSRRVAPLPAGLAGWLPLLVELHTYTDLEWRHGRAVTFLDLIDHLHTTQDVGLPRNLLEPFLSAGGQALVVFDGLDEIFDPRVRAQITAEIDGFAARYPKTRVVVTSRVLGYQRQMLDAAGFGHWMLQDLDPDQIRVFTAGWYIRSCPNDVSQSTRLTDRLLTAVDDSAAVAELAGNPMLLTILAIIGRRRELPRDRRSVYEHAVTVLVEHWDVNKHLRDADIDTDFLDVTDKLELLHHVARGMQDAPAGLSGNHIPGPYLVEAFRGYLVGRFDLPTSKAIIAARAMLDQFRTRNFILARFGSQVYGFVHRAFLEYLAADDINQRLINLDLTPDQILAVYESHWRDPAWAEVLLLLTGMIPDRLATRAIGQLLAADPHWRVRATPPRHLVLGLQAVAEIRRASALAPHARAISDALTTLLEEAGKRQTWAGGAAYDDSLSAAAGAVAARLLPILGPNWAGRDRYQRWYRSRGQHLAENYPYTATRAAARIHTALLPNPPADLHHAATHPNWALREVVVEAIAVGWADDEGTLPLLRERATTDDHEAVRGAAVRAIAAGWADDEDTLAWLRERATTDDHKAVRQAAVRVIAAGWADDEDTLAWLRERATTDVHEAARQAAVRAIAAGWADDEDTLPLLRERATTDTDTDVRLAAVEAIAAGWADDEDTLAWLRERATEDSWVVRQAAVRTARRIERRR